MLQAALEYAKAGYKILPCDNGKGKNPFNKEGKNGATTDEVQIRAWWSKWPAASIGMPLKINNLFALDLDRHKGKPDGVATWDKVCFKHQIPTRTAVMAISGGENPGQHLVYQHPGDGRVLRIPKDGAGIDVRDDQYIIVAPSRRADTGNSYKWIEGASILEVEPTPMPPNLLKWLTQKPTGLGGSPSDATVVLLVEVGGWTVVAVVEDNVRLHKPGDDEGHHATWDGKTFYNFSTEAPPFEPDTGYSAAQVEDLLIGPETQWFKDKVEALIDKAFTDHAGREEWLSQLAELLAKADPILQDSVAQRLVGANVCKKTVFRRQIKYAQKKLKESKAPGTERQAGVTTEEYAELFEMFEFELRLNGCNDDVELAGKYYDDIGLARIEATLADWSIRHPEKRISYRHLGNAVTLVAAENTYHPVKEYLESLTWDGEDHLGRLEEYLEGENFGRWFRHWAVAAVAKVYDQEQSPMLVLAGAPDIGKSTFVEWLAPKGMYSQEPLHPNVHDCRIRMWTTWIWEVAELGATMRQSVQEALKWILTLGVLRERKSYGHRDTIKPVTASFIGTVNPDSGFLWDRTGNRRYLVTEVTDIRWDYREDLSPDDLWAQAKAIYDLKDDSWRLTQEEKQIRDDQNLKYMGASVIAELLAKRFRRVMDQSKFVWAPEVLEALAEEGFRAANQNFALGEVYSIFRTWGSIGVEKMVQGRRGTVFPGIVKIPYGTVGGTE